MHIRSKVTLAVLGVVVLFSGFNLLLQYRVTRASFLELEQREAELKVIRVEHALQREVHHLDIFVHDWSAWDDTYRFVQDHDQDYIEANLILDTFLGSRNNVICLFDARLTLLWGRVVDLNDRDWIDWPGVEAQLRGLPLAGLVGGGESSLAGVLLTERGPLLLVARSVTTSDGKGVPNGVLVMGRLVDSALVRELIGQVLLPLELWGADSPGLPPEVKGMSAELARGVVIRAVTERMLHGYAMVPDLNGAPGVIIRVTFDRAISQRGMATIWWQAVALSLSGLLVILVLVGGLKRIVVAPLRQLTDQVVAAGKGRRAFHPLVTVRDDEVGILAREFAALVSSLDELRRRQSEQSFRFGMSEQAAATLHNLRNSLVPVVVDVEGLKKELERVAADHLEQAWRELASEATPHERRMELEQFVALAGVQGVAAVRSAREVVAGLGRRLAVIERMVLENEQVLAAKPPVEEFFLTELIAEAVAVIARQGIEVVVDPGIGLLGAFAGYRLLLLQVLVNIVVNAAEAIARAGVAKGRIEFNLEKVSPTWVVLAVCDNGCGVAAEELPRLFERGYSSKPVAAGHGLGLHWSAHAMNLMGGSLIATSAGVGRGACFELSFPRGVMG